MNNSYDLKHRILNFKGRLVHLYFLASLSNDVLISRLVEGIENREGKDLENCINMGDVEIVSTNQIQKIQKAVLGGNSALFDGEITYLMDTKNFPNRAIQEPETEKSVRGAKDGFNESILNNTGLIRRRIRSPELCFHLTTMGTQNPIDIAVAYLEDKVDRQVLQQLLTRISQVQTQEFIMTDRAIEEVLLNQGYNPFPLVRYSERPDIVATHIQHGYIAIICDTSSSIVMLPTTLFEILEHVEEHRQTPLIGTFIRLIRMIAVFLSIYLVPIFALSSSFLQWDYSFFIQILIMELSIELLRIATVHTPQSLSNAMGLIAAILLGEFAIQLGFFSEDILMFCAIGTVGGFATPNYELSLTNKYIKIMMIIAVMLLNIYGFIMFNLIFWISLARIKTFGVSYLYPLYPFHGKELLRFFIRQPKKD
ncbi:spore germination protein [Massilimicrobiota sp. SW1139]|uniref:spore germination protein n=1 Tax=Massilimicrobiota sp. SW1139 TaxID=2530043 RepID=UPI00143C1A9A|nr:spore germination protein [Massilimicrobiota sp. SW1139]NJE45143.1 spore germination protein [Massilimicrobiota sp. SW1139]